MSFDHTLLCGWGGQTLAIAANAQLGWRELGDYQLPRAAETRLLWQFAHKVLGGHIPNRKQEIGDCVSFGMANAVMYLSCVQIVQGARQEYHPVFQPYIYGTSRHDVGGDRLGNGDGSLGSWAAEAVKRHGILFADDRGVPPYSGGIAKQWGSRSGPPREFYELAEDNPVKTVAKVSTFEQAAQAISNGYPVTVASMQGFAMSGQIRDSKCWGLPQGSWAHQMVFVGVDIAARALFCLNSWGPDLWPEQPDGAPPGGFWVDERTCNRMLGQDDSWACSQFEGFPAQQLDHLLL